MNLVSKALKTSFLKIASLVVVLTSFAFGRSTQPKLRSTPSISQRIAAVQKAIREMPATKREPFFVRAQWGNWANWAKWVNWNNWNNWNNWAKWANWNNWGNWSNW